MVVEEEGKAVMIAAEGLLDGALLGGILKGRVSTGTSEGGGGWRWW